MKKIYIILILSGIFLNGHPTYASNSKKQYSSHNTSNYFSGVILSNKNDNEKAFKHLNKVKLLKNEHFQYNIEFIRILVLLKKFDQAFNFSREVWKEDDYFFEADLLLGLENFVKKDYTNAEKYFKRLNKASKHNLFFNDFIANVLLSWTKASQKDINSSFQYINSTPKPFHRLKKTQSVFLNCYFDTSETLASYKELINDTDYNFSRYNFFLANYLLSKNKNLEASKITKNIDKEYETNLLIKQTQKFLLNKNFFKIRNFFSCKNPKDTLAEFFYIISNLYSSEYNYELSNFYLQISLFLNKNFLSNKTLLAENYYFQKKYELSKNVYESIKVVGPVYYWHASKSIAKILLQIKSKEHAIKYLEKAFNSLPDKSFEHYYELANFYKNQNYYKESIKYYTLTLDRIKKNHPLIPVILDRRGTSFERVDDWESAEKDLKNSLKILPNQAHVLNYLAYTWIDKGINLKKGLKMLEKAAQLKENDGYIIDSLGWAHYLNKNYIEAELYLKKAVELMPSDPIINDHYADTLWMLNKSIQARYFWNYILSLENIEDELKDHINKKLFFGINKQL